MIKRFKHIIFLLFFFLQISQLAYSQDRPVKRPTPITESGETTEEVQDTVNKDLIIIDHSDVMVGIQGEGKELQKNTVRQVELRQGDIYMYCDKAFLFDNNDVKAWGNVIIQQGDSVNIFSDSLYYDGNNRKAELFGNVVLESTEQKLFTDKLNYDLNTKTATYFNGATLTNGETQLTSKIGYYYVSQDEAYFKDSVIVVDPEFELKSDTLRFDTKEKKAVFLGPTLVAQNDGQIYCEEGFYDTQNKNAEFKTNAQYQKGEQKAWADLMKYDGSIKETTLIGNAKFIEGEKIATADVIRYEEETKITNLDGNAYFKDKEQEIRSDKIRYDSENEVYNTTGRSKVNDEAQILEADFIKSEGKVSVATGNVIWRDTVQNISISNCDSARYVKEEDLFKAMGGRPLLTKMMDDDTLFLSADTLISFLKNPEDSVRTLLANRNVKIFKTDLQAICDSLIYSEADSIFQFYKQPIIWSDTSQFSADTIYIQMANEKIDQIDMIKNAFMINSPDEENFNQIKGKDITAYFENDDVRRMNVTGNAESVYWARDDNDAYIGANKVLCSSMLMYFGNNEVEDIRFYNKPDGSFTPMNQVKKSEIELAGFKWVKDDRPISLSSILKKSKLQVVAPLAKSETTEEEKPTNNKKEDLTPKSKENDKQEEKNKKQSKKQ